MTFSKIISVLLLLPLVLFALFFASSRTDELAKRGARPLVFAFQRQIDPSEMAPRAERVAERLSQEMGQKVRAIIPGDYATSVQAIVSNTADIAYVDSMSFLLAARDGGAELLLAEEREDSVGEKRTDYDSLFVVREESSLGSYEDLVENAGEVAIAFTSRSSSSGYLFPYRRMVHSGLLNKGERVEDVFGTAFFAGSYDLALREVLAGRADVATVSSYTMEGASAERYLSPKERSELRVLARTPGVPTHVLVARSGLSIVLRQRVAETIVRLSSQEPALFADVYGASFFVPVGDNHVAATREALQLAGVPF